MSKLDRINSIKDKIKNNSVGILGLTYFEAIVITDILYGIEDRIEFYYISTDLDYISRKHTAKVHYNLNGRCWFRSGGNRYYMDEFLRTNL